MTASGGTSYLWSTGATTAAITESPTATTTYTVTVTNANNCSATATQTITVNPLPTPAIAVTETSGTAANDAIICSGDNATMTASGGTTYLWNTGATTAALTVSPSTTTTYTVTVTNANNCSATATQTIIVNPFPIPSMAVTETSGTAANDGTICVGASATMTASGGTTYLWSTGATSAALTVSPTATTTYTVTVTNANNCSATATQTITVDPIPTPAIAVTETSGTANNDAIICVGASATMTASGGTTYLWSTGATTAAITESPITTTTYTVTVTNANNCSATATQTITVNPLPTPAIAVTETSGTANNDAIICVGASAAMTASGGTTYLWSTGATTAAISESPTATTTYTVTVTNANNCSATVTQTITVNPLPTISGTMSACAGLTSSLTGSATAHPTTPWLSSNTAVATVSSTGVVTALTAGTTTITYMNNNGCIVTGTFTVNPLPTITGTMSACAGSTSSLTGSATPDATTPWTSSNTAVATVSSTGVVTALTAGTTTITYMNNNGCIVTGTFTVFVLPTITGTTVACVGLTSTLIGAGTPHPTTPWTSSNTAVATVSSTGVVTALSAGTTIITYRNNNNCIVTTTFTVNALPTITGTMNACLGLTSSLTGSATAHPTTPWTSSNPAVASVSSTGLVTALSVGTTTITYMNNNGCIVTGSFTVNALPTFSGTMNICAGSTSTLTGSATAHPTTPWTSSNTAVATVSSTGVVTALTAGTTTITYMNSNGCIVTGTFTVFVLPTITGTMNACLGSTSSLTGAGTPHPTTPWVSSNTAVASVSSTGLVTALTAGTTNITYMNNNGCIVTGAFTVNPLPTMGGTMNACAGLTSTLTGSATAHPTTPWTSSNTAVATVSSTGVVTALSAGTTTITYMNNNGCIVTGAFTVNPLPTMSGTMSACVGATETLTGSATAHPTTPWTSSNTAVATISSTGVVTALSAGTTTITYRNSNGCIVTGTFTVSVLSSITGTMSACVGFTSTLTGSGTAHPTTPWISSNPAVATVSSTGVVTALTAGTTTITYRNNNNCIATGIFTVNPLPAAPTAVTLINYCQGATATALTATGTSLLWYTAATGGTGSTTAPIPSTATVGSTNFYVSQTTAFGCEGPRTLIVVNINPIPVAPTVTSPVNLCIGGATAALTATGTNLKWYTVATGGTSSATAPVPSTATLGTSNFYVSQTSSFGCEGPRSLISVTVNPLPTVTISSLSPYGFFYCEGLTVTLKANSATAKLYNWDFAGTPVAGATFDTFSVGVTGTWGVTVRDTFGCRARASVAVNKAPASAKTVLSPTTAQICEEGSVLLTCSPGFVAFTYTWIKDGLPILPSTPTENLKSATAPGNYVVYVMNTFGCFDTTNVAVVTNYPKPIKPVIVHTPPTMKVASIYTYYQWYRNGTQIVGANNYQLNTTTPGKYFVQITDENGCLNNSDTIEILQPNSINNVTTNGVIKIYPNPTQSIVNIDAPIPVNVVVTDLTGRIVADVKDAKSVDLENYADGTYIFRLFDQSNQLISIQKISKSSNR